MTAAPISQNNDIQPGSNVPVDNNQFDLTKEIPEYAIMLLIIMCLKLHQGNLEIQADQLQGNAGLQEYWETQIKNIHNIIPPKDAGNYTLEQISAENAAKGTERANDEDILITQRQEAHILMTQASSETNEVQQAASVVSFVLQTYLSEGKVIVGMNGNNS